MSARPPVSGVAFTAQAWDGGKVSEIEGLSYDAARHIAQAHAAMGQTGRIMSEDAGTDWTEVYCPDGTMRCGPFARTVYVTMPGATPAGASFTGWRMGR